MWTLQFVTKTHTHTIRLNENDIDDNSLLVSVDEQIICVSIFNEIQDSEGFILFRRTNLCTRQISSSLSPILEHVWYVRVCLRSSASLSAN
jgi:hypothetical protein